MNTKDYFKDMYTDFFGVESIPKIEVKKDSEVGSQEKMASLFQRINELLCFCIGLFTFSYKNGLYLSNLSTSTYDGLYLSAFEFSFFFNKSFIILLSDSFKDWYSLFINLFSSFVFIKYLGTADILYL